MVEKSLRSRPSEQPRELNLSAGRRQEIFAADDERHTLVEVIHRNGELVGPVAESVADQQVAARVEGPLFLRSQRHIIESLDGRFDPDAHAESSTEREMSFAATAR